MCSQVCSQIPSLVWLMLPTKPGIKIASCMVRNWCVITILSWTKTSPWHDSTYSTASWNCHALPMHCPCIAHALPMHCPCIAHAVMPVRKCWHHIADCFVQRSSHQCTCKSYKFWHFKILQRQDFLVCGLWVFCQGASPLINWRSEVMGPHKQPSMPFGQRADRFCSSSDKPSPFKII